MLRIGKLSSSRQPAAGYDGFTEVSTTARTQANRCPIGLAQNSSRSGKGPILPRDHWQCSQWAIKQKEKLKANLTICRSC
jgi:hypothetical protein